MKKILILSLMLLSLSVIATGQEKRLNSAPQSFRTFYASFKRAVERSDKRGVAAMSRFPFSYGYDAGDEGKYSRSQFIRNFNRIFDDNPRVFFTERNPGFGREGNKYYISTEDAAHLGFVKTGKTFKFVSYIVEP